MWRQAGRLGRGAASPDCMRSGSAACWPPHVLRPPCPRLNRPPMQPYCADACATCTGCVAALTEFSASKLASLPPAEHASAIRDMCIASGASAWVCNTAFSTVAAHPEISTRPAALCKAVSMCRCVGCLWGCCGSCLLHRCLHGLSLSNPRPTPLLFPSPVDAHLARSDDCLGSLNLSLCSINGTADGVAAGPALAQGVCTATSPCSDKAKTCDSFGTCTKLTKVGGAALSGRLPPSAACAPLQLLPAPQRFHHWRHLSCPPTPACCRSATPPPATTCAPAAAPASASAPRWQRCCRA